MSFRTVPRVFARLPVGTGGGLRRGRPLGAVAVDNGISGRSLFIEPRRVPATRVAVDKFPIGGSEPFAAPPVSSLQAGSDPSSNAPISLRSPRPNGSGQ